MSRSKRKLEHIDHAMETGQIDSSGLEDIRFIHQSLPDINLKDVSIASSIGELQLSSPIFINAMTGGGGKATENINAQLAEIANTLSMPMAVGSQMAAIKDTNERRSYQIVREKHPKGVIFANLGSEATVEQAKTSIEMIEADAIQIHLNVIQELVMPEGDRDFTGALQRIEKICEAVPVPVIVKEVGFGMSKETVRKLYEAGVKIVDIGGFGGTNFSKIENNRRLETYQFFNDWGIPTAVSIIEAKYTEPDIQVIATGGIKNALHIAKAISLGANAVGMAGKILKWLHEIGADGTTKNLQGIFNELRVIMTAVGARNINDLQRTPVLIQGTTNNWLKERQISTEYYANRTKE
ncbi:isopentenyl-diphosphate delta-isomerase [Evansella vedderi]|uniref:Isopentenyl-diphosphate delta-isomerase n=1 Tax=Evansella vedderi TaxID=38282 RepID=A0ABU0A1Y1_9BACI|nr:type 2 isopentenyl-diphosphate Delta-isomerase [Evansella vedderi]MDQ0257496.1 isopentenyl-diphosphate delta-isomerase [Evansella vedderi]